MTIGDVVARKGITEVLHYTTHLGLVGILDGAVVKSRSRLGCDQRLEHILRLNTRRVMDPGWEDYVNLSVTRINVRLFGISSIHWHPDVWWAILVFDPEILEHPDVTFTTTNNIYPSVLRNRGELGLEAMFAPVVRGRYGVVHQRTPMTPDNFTTDAQAEVLYPGEIATTFLRRVYVTRDDRQDEVYGQMRGLGHREVEVVVDPARFQEAV
jgi:hypothetical protein